MARWKPLKLAVPGEGVTVEAEADAVRALETAISALRNQLELTNRLAERLDPARDESRRPDQLCRTLAEQALTKLQAERDGAEALRIQLEAEVERLGVPRSNPRKF